MRTSHFQPSSCLRSGSVSRSRRRLSLILSWRVSVDLLGLALLIWASCGSVSRISAHEPGSEAFFEQRIRPVLVKHCYQCHSSDAEETGGTLWLDSADAMRRGGDSGPVIHPGDSTGSLLISAIRYESSEMPPDQPLSPQVIKDFEAWVDAGAVDPRNPESDATANAEVAPSIDLEKGRQFWAFRPLSDFRSELPRQTRLRLQNVFIDDRLDDALAAAGIRALGVAESQARLRRLAFDLTGLPPGDAVRQRWARSPTESTWREIVDQLLQSRSFAQHWARHWMDVARYADSNGSDFNATFHDAWRYRDYLINALDRDQPLDQMIRQQVAGDLLPADSDRERHDNLVATTFLMLGPKMLSERAKDKLTLDVVDEQIDTIGRAFLGMTLGCARCHDHKFDPIPTEDYYALAGIFRSTRTLNGESQKYVSTWNRVPLPVDPKHQAAIAEYALQSKLIDEKIKRSESVLRELSASRHPGIVIDDAEANQTGSWTHSTVTKGFVGKGYVHDNNTEKGKRTIEFRTRLPESGQYVVRFAFSAGSNRAAKVPLTLVSAEGEKQLTVDQRTKNESPPWSDLGTFRFSDQQDAVLIVSNDQTDGYVIADAIAFVPVSEPEVSAVENADEEIAVRIREAERSLQELRDAKTELEKQAPAALPYAMAPGDLPAEEHADSPVQIRGEVHNVGENVPRGFLQVCVSGDASIDSPVGSGRLELAGWLTDPDHPLVARVMVNRVWSHLFGEGLVRTVDNFGSRGDRPSHPQLLDALAIDFMREGWQLKPLIRRIVLSKAYNRSSDFDADAAQSDPENRMLWRHHRKRLTAESVRDSMLVAAGFLTEEEPIEPVGDKGVLVTKNVATTDAVASGIERPVRTVYLPLIRGNVSPMLSALDVADPDLLVGKRPTTNVPGQALVLINNEHINDWALATADRIYQQHASWRDRLRAVYTVCLSRKPSEANLEVARHYVGVDTIEDEDQLRERFRDFVAAVFASTEFRMID